MQTIKCLSIIAVLFCWKIAIAQSPPSSNPNDCLGSILICGTTDIGIIPNGAGFNEFSDPDNPIPSCIDFGRLDQAWFRVEIETTGTFTFVINPDDSRADYDFSVFGPTTDCGNLGAAIRCSSTNPQNAGVPAATGLNAIETDINEGPGPDGNGFLRQMDVVAGETYYIIVGLAIGAGGFSISTGGTTTFPQGAIANSVPDIVECDDDDGIRDGIKQFDFTSLDSQILGGQTNALVSYHTSLNDANIGIDPLVFPYTNTSPIQNIFYRVQRTDSECADFNQFQLRVDNSRIDRDLRPQIICSTNPTEIFDFATVIDELVVDSNVYDLSNHTSLNDAINDRNPNGSVFTATRVEQIVFIKVKDPTGNLCDRVINVPLLVDSPPAIAQPLDLILCDDDFNGILTIDLSAQNAQILNGLNPDEYTVAYYTSLANRNTGTSPVSRFTNSSNPQELFVAVTRNATGCIATTEFDFLLNERPILAPQPDKTFCLESVDPLVLSVEPGYAFYEWSTGESGALANSISVMAPGEYTVIVTNLAGCQSDLSITVRPSNIATVTFIEITDFQRGNNSVTINVTGPGDYEFAVDDRAFQDSPEFQGLSSGFHEFRVRDKNGCGTFRSQFGILDFQPFFTPNFDGYNDVWTLDALSEYPDARLFIYDRFGKLLKQITAASPGWDGTFNGELMPSSTYWFSIEIPDRPIVKGYFALKR